MFPLILRESKGSPLTHQELDQNLINLLLPAGIITSFGGVNIPDGWLKCDGSIISRTEYSRLFNAIGELYGAGDGENTFQLPDLRGEFIRGLDDGRGVDSSREIGSFQEATDIPHAYGWSGSGIWRISVPCQLNTTNSAKNVDSWSDAQGPRIQFQTTHTNTNSNLSFTARPRNVAFHYIIKY